MPRPSLLLTLFLCASTLRGEEIKVTPADDWFARLNGDGLRPGDHLVFAAGTYSDARLLELRHRGTEAQPITIRPEHREKVIFKRPDARQNSFNLVGCQHLTLRGFEITGGDAGIRIRADGEHQPVAVRLESLHIHHIGGAAITCNNTGSYYQDMVFARNHIHHTGGHGEGFYLGCNNDKDGNTPGYIFDSIIEGNHIHDLKGGTVSQGDGIEIKDGSFGNLVRDNTIHDTKYPGITIYGTDGKAQNVVESNRIWNTGDHGIQAAADVIIRNNIVSDAGGDLLHVREHQSAKPGNLLITNNTFVQHRKGGSGIRVQRPSGGFTSAIHVRSNAIYASIPLRLPKDPQLTLKGNLVTGDRSKDLNKDFLPVPGSLLLKQKAGARRP